MTHRLYLAPPLASGTTRLLDADANHYLTRVLRLRSGAPLVCFDGQGKEFAGTVERQGKTMAIAVGALQQEQQPPPALHLVLAWLKSQAMDNAVQKATELGISDFWPLLATRSNVKIDAKRTRGRLDHWRKVAIHACQQSERLFVPTVHEPVDLEAWLAANQELHIILLAPGAPPITAPQEPSPLALLVGPEGGWTEAETALAQQHGALSGGLGRWVLRAETAPLASLASVRHSWGWR